MEILQIKWTTRDDGVIYFEPVGFVESYFIYPAYYDEEDPTPRLYVINSHGGIDHMTAITDLHEGQDIACARFKSIITRYLPE